MMHSSQTIIKKAVCCRLLTTVLLCGLSFVMAYAETVSSASLGQVPRLAEIADYPCLHTDGGRDSLRFPGSHARFLPFYSRLDTLLNEQRGQVRILHIGGSHVQAGYFSHRVRTDMDSLGGFQVGDRGLLFPFRAIRTNAPVNYRFRFQGEWQGARCVKCDSTASLGLSGALAVTYDTLATLTLNTDDIRRWSPDHLRLLGEASAPDVTPLLVCAGDTLTPLPSDGTPGYLFDLPLSDSICTVAFRGLGHDSVSFTVRGLLPYADRDGLTYTESGINGAAVPSWLRCTRFQEELSLVQPDLVVLGIGINDANVLPRDFNPEIFKENYRMLLRQILSVSPHCCFLFITNNDCWFNVRGKRRQFNTNTAKVQQAMVELATEYDAAVFDVFALMGGIGSSSAWVRHGLQKRDHIHFTQVGYELCGDLLYNALVRDYLSTRQQQEEKP